MVEIVLSESAWGRRSLHCSSPVSRSPFPGTLHSALISCSCPKDEVLGFTRAESCVNAKKRKALAK